jgi:hypothetical protein
MFILCHRTQDKIPPVPHAHTSLEIPARRDQERAGGALPSAVPEQAQARPPVALERVLRRLPLGDSRATHPQNAHIGIEGIFACQPSLALRFSEIVIQFLKFFIGIQPCICRFWQPLQESHSLICILEQRAKSPI